jgi:hypothetical protein
VNSPPVQAERGESRRASRFNDDGLPNVRKPLNAIGCFLSSAWPHSPTRSRPGTRTPCSARLASSAVGTTWMRAGNARGSGAVLMAAMGTLRQRSQPIKGCLLGALADPRPVRESRRDADATLSLDPSWLWRSVRRLSRRGQIKDAQHLLTLMLKTRDVRPLTAPSLATRTRTRGWIEPTSILRRQRSSWPAGHRCAHSNCSSPRATF